MPSPDRFILWPNDSALDARDQVLGDIFDRIEESLAESDASWLNCVVAYLCCLSAVAGKYGGLIAEYERIERWRKQIFGSLETAWQGDENGDEYQAEKAYVGSIFNSLFEAVDASTIESAREPWEAT